MKSVQKIKQIYNDWYKSEVRKIRIKKLAKLELRVEKDKIKIEKEREDLEQRKKDWEKEKRMIKLRRLNNIK